MENTYEIRHDLFIRQNIQIVFQAVCYPEHLVNWWPLKCSGIPSAGETYNFFFSTEYDWYGRVIKAESPHHFYIEMTRSDEDWDGTRFGFDLEELEGGVQLQFWHIGWPQCNHHFRRSSFCWAMLLNGLKNYVEKGVIVPFEERE